MLALGNGLAQTLQHQPAMRASNALALALALASCSRIEPGAITHDCRRTEVLDQGLLPERVRWERANEERDHNILDHWCATVGPAVLRAKPSVIDSLPIDSIAIVSWNTHVGGGDIERFVRDLRRGRFTNGDSVKHFVMLLQEVYRASDSVPATVPIGTPGQIKVDPPSGERRDIVATASTLGLSLLYIPSMRNGAATNEDRGNAILSTLELHNPHALELPFERQRRVVASAELKGRASSGDWDFVIASVHLDNRATNLNIARSTGALRYRQAHAVVDALEDEDRVVVTGDFNTWSIGLFEKALPLMREHFEDSPPAPPEITYVKGRMRSRLDYMFFRIPDGWRARYQRIGSRYGSDHYPLLGWLRVTGTTADSP